MSEHPKFTSIYCLALLYLLCTWVGLVGWYIFPIPKPIPIYWYCQTGYHYWPYCILGYQLYCCGSSISLNINTRKYGLKYWDIFQRKPSSLNPSSPSIILHPSPLFWFIVTINILAIKVKRNTFSAFSNLVQKTKDLLSWGFGLAWQSDLITIFSHTKLKP